MQVAFQLQRTCDPHIGVPGALQQPRRVVQEVPADVFDKFVQVMHAAGDLRIRCAP